LLSLRRDLFSRRDLGTRSGLGHLARRRAWWSVDGCWGRAPWSREPGLEDGVDEGLFPGIALQRNVCATELIECTP